MAAALFPAQLLGQSGELLDTAQALAGKTFVMLYFSAHWCPPCRGFTPELAKMYADKAQEKNIEVVFISGDKDESSFQEYFKEMPWLALPFDQNEKGKELNDKYGVQGIPTLVVLDGDGNVVTTEGRGKAAEFFGASTTEPTSFTGGLPLPRGNTTQMVDAVAAQQRKVLMFGLLGNVLGLLNLAMMIYGMLTQTNDNCKTDPVHWKDWYLGSIIAGAVALVLGPLALYGVSKVSNKHMITAQIHQAKGDIVAANQDRAAGLDEAKVGQSLLARAGGALCCVICFNLAWFIIAIVLMTRSTEEVCASSRSWFWAILCVSFVAQFVLSCLKQCSKPKSQPANPGQV